MNTPEQAPLLEQNPDFGMEMFDIQAAFHGALSDIATDAQTSLDQKVQRIENLLTEGSSETYREFIDFRQIATHMEMVCSHDHDLNVSLQGNVTFSNFMNSHGEDDGHGHTEAQHGQQEHDDDDDNDDDSDDDKSKKRRKTKKTTPIKHSWFGVKR